MCKNKIEKKKREMLIIICRTIYVESEANVNCILYKKRFDSIETTTMSNSNLFIKKSKI